MPLNSISRSFRSWVSFFPVRKKRRSITVHIQSNNAVVLQFIFSMSLRRGTPYGPAFLKSPNLLIQPCYESFFFPSCHAWLFLQDQANGEAFSHYISTMISKCLPSNLSLHIHENTASGSPLSVLDTMLCESNQTCKIRCASSIIGLAVFSTNLFCSILYSLPKVKMFAC